MQRTELHRPAGRIGEITGQQRRGIRGNERVRRQEPRHLAIDLGLDVRHFRHGLDDEIGLRDRCLQVR